MGFCDPVRTVHSKNKIPVLPFQVKKDLTPYRCIRVG